MGKSHKKQQIAGSNPLGVSHQHDPLTQFKRIRQKYVVGHKPVPAEFDNFMISIKKFTIDQVRSIRLKSNAATLSVLYNHCKTTPNLMDTHGFTPDDITRIMRVQGAAHNLMAAFNHIETLKLYCHNDKDKIVALTSFTGASCSIAAICSDMTAKLIRTHGFSTGQLVDVVSRVGGKRKLELLDKYAAPLLQLNISHDDIVAMLKQGKSAEDLELAIRELLPPTPAAHAIPVAPPTDNTQNTNQPAIVHQGNHNAAPNQQGNNNATVNQQTTVHIDVLSMDDEFQFDLDEIFNTSIGDIPPQHQPTGQMFTTQWGLNKHTRVQDEDEDDELGMVFEWGSAFK